MGELTEMPLDPPLREEALIGREGMGMMPLIEEEEEIWPLAGVMLEEDMWPLREEEL